MGTHKLAGFTVIEVVLFLAISSALIVGLISATGLSLNNQRYKDAADTFKSTLQQQYADLMSVQNAREDNWYCGAGAQPDEDAGTQQDRGQSDCMLMGKYLRIENGDISIYSVIGYGSEPFSASSDIAALRNNYLLNVSNAEVSESRLEWGTQIAWPKNVASNTPGVVGPPNTVPTTPRKLGILIVRSPGSGQIYTFTHSGTAVPAKNDIRTTTLSNMLVAGNTTPGQGSQLICIESNGLFINSDRAVYLNSFASASSAVELRSNDFMKQSGGPQC